MSSAVKPGDRVIVRIARPDEWAVGAADALNGTTGTVEEVKAGSGNVLVSFDRPARTWHANQRPPKSFWFSTNELEVLS